MERSSICLYINFGAGTSTVMSFSEALGLSIFRRKMKKTRFMKEEMDGKGKGCLILPPLEPAFSL